MDSDRSSPGRRSETTNTHSNSSTDQSVNISGNNNVYINGNVSGYYPTPYRADRYHTVIRRHHFQQSSHWLDCGSYYVLNWSQHSCGRVIGLQYAPYYGYGVSYYYPSYHRKHLFFSIGGYWPDYYRYRRYYWYGCHPYRWYGAYVIDPPLVQPVVQNVYHITYETPAPVGAGYNYDYKYDPAYEDFSDVREKIRREAAARTEDSPQPETSADMCFEQAVQLFAQGKYEQAVFKLRVAMILEPEDVVLPFAYSQALFATGDYDAASAALSATLETMKRQDQETVYYPRGLYEDEKVLHTQIAALAEAVRKNPEKADYQLLLGYQLLGSGRVDEAITPLHETLESNVANAPAMMLIKLLEQIKADQAAAEAAAAQGQPLESGEAADTAHAEER
ncbi:MAG: tetratricopeptide repeat protein [Phycisphaerae bacterium]|nr:tetratricopeptide repeat protein [Phycisphaerae bacterium]